MSNDHYICNPYNPSVPVNICSRQRIENPRLFPTGVIILWRLKCGLLFLEFIVLKQGHRMPAEKTHSEKIRIHDMVYVIYIMVCVTNSFSSSLVLFWSCATVLLHTIKWFKSYSVYSFCYSLRFRFSFLPFLFISVVLIVKLWQVLYLFIIFLLRI